MKTLDFVRAAKAERDALASSYAAENAKSAVGAMLSRAQLSELQKVEVMAALDQALTDAFYGMLLALDGAASLGGIQASYRLTTEDGAVIADGDGSLEAAAFEVFQAG